MLMRTYENLNASNEALVNGALNQLADQKTSVCDYRSAFATLGKELGKIVAERIDNIVSEEIMLVCASEDADWLAKGVVEGLNKGNIPISVFWSTREVLYEDGSEKLEVTPITKSYEEPIDKCRILIIVKSIISSSCVVKTQLTRLIGKMNPEKIEILAPVMYKDGKPNLIKEFPDDISAKFNFITFAVDDLRDDSGSIVPGVGGMVYPRLGLGDIDQKNSYIPDMVLERI